MQTLRWIGHWFAFYPILGLLALGLTGIIAFGAGAPLGVPDMFWRQTRGRSFVNGIALAFAFALISFNGFLLESRDDPRVALIPYFVRTFPVLVVLLLIGAWRFRREGDVADYGRVALVLLGFALAAAAIFFLLPVAQPNQAAMLIFAAVFLLYVILAITLPNIPSGTAICIFFSLLLLAYGVVRFHFGRGQLVAFVLIVVWMAVMSYVTPYRHRFPDLRELYRHPGAIPGGPNPELINDDEAFAAWARRTGPSPKLVVIATSGGGIRAAVWTGAVLQHLSKEIAGFTDHVRVISGASGGMVGAANFVAAIAEDGAVNDEHAGQVGDVAHDSMEPTIRTFVLRDIPMLFLPGSSYDRGVALEDAWKRTAVALRKSFADLAEGERAGWRPSLIFTPMFVEDGRRAIISNLDLEFLARNAGPQITDPPRDLYSVSNVELFKVIPKARAMSVASAARMNASFPGTSPSASVPTNPERHIVDASYWDNFGVSIAGAWIAQHFKAILENTSGVVLLQIRDEQEEAASQNAALPGRSAVLAALADFVAPVLGVLQARGAVTRYRNDGDVEELADTFRAATGDPEFFTTVILENPKKSVLSWALTSRQSSEMIEYFEHAAPDEEPVKRIRKLREWWERPAPESPRGEAPDASTARAAAYLSKS